MHKIIAIDGPCAAGKTTQAKLLAKELGYMYVDTGAMYRTIALYIQKNAYDISDIDNILSSIDMSIKNVDGEQRMFLENEDVTFQLRTAKISVLASDISAIKQVRQYLLQAQRDFAEAHDIVMEGRDIDIGTVIFPDADVKFYLTADVETRATRRWTELFLMDMHTTEEATLEDIKLRDHNDSTRKDAPLKQADDAILVDCSNMSLEETTRVMLEYIKQNI